METQATTGCCLKAEKRGNEIVRATILRALAQFYREHSAFLLAFYTVLILLRSFEIYSRDVGRQEEISPLPLYVL